MNREVSSTDRPVDRLARWNGLDPLARLIQPPLRALLDGTGPRAWLKDLLHGTTFGHPLHPAITDVPVGAWTMTALFDACELAGYPGFAGAADVALGTGIAGAVAAAATGWAEWSDTSGEPQRLGLVHALGNGTALGLYAVSLAARRAGSRGLGIAAAYAGYALVSAAAYLGGELSFNHGIGTKHTAEPITPSGEFVAVCAESEITTGHVRADFGGIPVLISRTTDGVAAVSAVCTHRGASLDAGTFADGCVTCPWHGARFSLADGTVREGPAVYPLARFETRIVNGTIELRPIR